MESYFARIAASLPLVREQQPRFRSARTLSLPLCVGQKTRETKPDKVNSVQRDALSREKQFPRRAARDVREIADALTKRGPTTRTDYGILHYNLCRFICNRRPARCLARATDSSLSFARFSSDAFSHRVDSDTSWEKMFRCAGTSLFPAR